MSSEIRTLLAAAQQAEAKGDVTSAVTNLREATRFYRSRRMERRAAQMERQIERLEGRAVEVPLSPLLDDGFGRFDEDDEATTQALDEVPFGDEAEGRFTASSVAPAPQDDGLGFGDDLLAEGRVSGSIDASMVERGPQRADPALEAWCSFCCKPGTEIGSLIAGPAGAYICGSCVSAGARLLSLPPLPVLRRTPTPQQNPNRSELPAQARARAEWDRRRPRVSLVIGPEGSGKSAFLGMLGKAVERPFHRVDGDLALVDVSFPLSPEEAFGLQQWLDARPQRRAVLAVRGQAPSPVLVLQGEHGEEPVFDTESLHRAVDAQLPAGVLSRVDAVLPMQAPDDEALMKFAQSLLVTRSIELPEHVLASLMALALKSGRGATELVSLIARIPTGRYRAKEP